MDSSCSNYVFTSIILFLIFSSVTLDLHLTCNASDVDLECPNPFTEGLSSIKCKINITAIASRVCFVTPSVVAFDFTLNGKTSTLCRATPYPNCIVDDTKACGCSDQTGELITYTYKFPANSSLHKDGSLACNLCANAQPPLDTTSTQSCKKITFETPDNGSTVSCSTQCILGLCLGLGLPLMCVCIGLLLAHYVFHWKPSGCKKKKPGSGPEMNPALKPMQS